MGLIYEGTSGIYSMPGFDVQIALLRVLLCMKIFQDKSFLVTIANKTFPCYRPKVEPLNKFPENKKQTLCRLFI